MLAETAHNAGVITNEEFVIFQNAGYMGLYGGLDVEGILAAVYQSVFGGDVYPSLEEKVANLLFNEIDRSKFADWRIMRAEELWKTYCEKEKIDIDTPYEAWRFGDAPDKLADLVLKGIKTATASGYDLYFMEGEEEQLPQPGDYNVILDAKDEAVCVIQTTKTTVVPFDEVSEEHAYKEGEGDRSLAYWRAVHEEFFTKEFEETKNEFNGQTRILCEEFQVVYKARDIN